MSLWRTSHDRSPYLLRRTSQLTFGTLSLATIRLSSGTPATLTTG